MSIKLSGIAWVQLKVELGSYFFFIWTFQLFPLVWLTTGGGPAQATEVLSTLTYRLAFVNFEFSQASASGFYPHDFRRLHPSLPSQ